MQQSILDILSSDSVFNDESSKKAFESLREAFETAEIPSLDKIFSKDSVANIFESLTKDSSTKKASGETEQNTMNMNNRVRANQDLFAKLFREPTSVKESESEEEMARSILSSLFTGSQPRSCYEDEECSLDLSKMVEDAFKNVFESPLKAEQRTPLVNQNLPTKVGQCPVQKKETITISKSVLNELLQDDEEVSTELFNELNVYLFKEKADQRTMEILFKLMDENPKEMARKLFST